jgi:hypothetical protein
MEIPITRFAMSSMNYLFLQHVTGTVGITSNPVIEEILERFFIEFRKMDYENEEVQHYQRMFVHDAIVELLEGEYFHKYDLEQFKKRTENSFRAIFGYIDEDALKHYSFILEKAYQKFQESGQ